MKYGIRSIALLVVTLSMVGCIETQMLVTVRSDGGGSIREHVQMKSEMVAMLRQMTMSFQAAFSDDDETPAEPPAPKEFFSEEEIRQNAEKLGSDVRYVSHEMIDDGRKMGYVALYEFDDINTVHVNQNPGASMPEMGGDVGGVDSEEEFVLFSFTPGSPARLIIRPPSDEEDENEMTEWADDEDSDADGEEESAEGFDQMVEFLRDMRVLVQVAVEGGIVESNATHVDGNVITLMDIDFNKLLDDPDKLKQLEKAETMSPAAAKALLKDIPGLRVEVEDEVFVSFR